MQLGKKVLIREQGKIIECEVIKILGDELEVTDGINTYRRKWWEIGKIKND